MLLSKVLMLSLSSRVQISLTFLSFGLHSPSIYPGGLVGAGVVGAGVGFWVGFCVGNLGFRVGFCIGVGVDDLWVDLDPWVD